MSATQQGQQQVQVDLSQHATVSLPLFQWNAVLGCLRTGTGEQFTWDLTNPLITTISNQLQQTMNALYAKQQQGLQQGVGPAAQQTVTSRSNGEAQTFSFPAAC